MDVCKGPIIIIIIIIGHWCVFGNLHVMYTMHDITQYKALTPAHSLTTGVLGTVGSHL